MLEVNEGSPSISNVARYGFSNILEITLLLDNELSVVGTLNGIYHSSVKTNLIHLLPWILDASCSSFTIYIAQ